MVDLMIAFAGLATAKQMNVMMEKLMIKDIVFTLFLLFLVICIAYILQTNIRGVAAVYTFIFFTEEIFSKLL